MARDIGNVSHKKQTIKFQSDQETSIVALQHEAQRVRSGFSIPVNSPVGGSASNGRVENAIRRVQDKVRTLEAHVEGEIGVEIAKMEKVASWPVIWAGRLITKYSLGKHGKTAHEGERVKGQSCNKPLAQFGGHELYRP